MAKLRPHGSLALQIRHRRRTTSPAGEGVDAAPFGPSPANAQLVG
jgi:hypothetical protein